MEVIATFRLVAAIFKTQNGGYHKNYMICLTYGMIVYVKSYAYTTFSSNIHMQTEVIAIFSFFVAAILKLQNGGHYKVS